MPGSSDQDTGYWECRGAVTLGRVVVSLCLWLEDLTISDQMGAHRGGLCSSCPGNRTVATAGSCLHLYRWVKQPGNRRYEGECVSKIAVHSLSPIIPWFLDTAHQGPGKHHPHQSSSCQSMVGGWGASRDSAPGGPL